MKKIRCTLLCLTLLSAMCMVTGCRNNRDNNGTTSQAPNSSSAGAGESSSAMQNTSSANDLTDGAYNTSHGYENGAGSRATDEGTSLHETAAENGTGVMDDLGDLGSDIGRDITNAVDDLTGGQKNTENR